MIDNICFNVETLLKKQWNLKLLLKIIILWWEEIQSFSFFGTR